MEEGWADASVESADAAICVQGADGGGGVGVSVAVLVVHGGAKGHEGDYLGAHRDGSWDAAAQGALACFPEDLLERGSLLIG